MAPFTDAARAIDETNFRPRSSRTTPTAPRSRWRSTSACATDRTARYARRLHAGDVAGARQAGGAQPGLVAQAVHAGGRARAARRGLRRPRLRRRVLRPLRRRPRRRRLRAFAAARGIRPASKRSPGAASARRPSPTATGRSITADRVGLAGLRGWARTGRRDHRRRRQGRWRPACSAAVKARKPGDRVTVDLQRRGGATGTATIALEEDPSLEVVTVESTGGTLTADQRAFRDAWLGSRIRSKHQRVAALGPVSENMTAIAELRVFATLGALVSAFLLYFPRPAIHRRPPSTVLGTSRPARAS